MYNKISKLASAVYNNVNSGLQGMTTNDSMSKELLEDSVVLERLQILKEYSLKGILPYKDLYVSINCIPVDCKDITNCSNKCKELESELEPVAHFEIPQLMNDYGDNAIKYIGSIDKQLPFVTYTSINAMKYNKFRKRSSNKPLVWIDSTPNENNCYDCYLFNAPMIKQVSIIAIFKDLRQLEQYSCCTSDDNFSFIDNEIVKRLTEKMIRFYRQYKEPVTPNDQMYKEG